ncbi:MAG: hydroxyectoine utilization dehydratase EutB [Gemmatimonadota bacterium]|nr:MAG: hydroxyectoine utilization dehydratase EutB [Gemmatimonadota bacterium]
MDPAATRSHVARFAQRTPLFHDVELSEHHGSPVHLKLECLQVTGSFKVRGAASRMLALTREERRRGVVTCSSGNHGRAVSYVARHLEVPATICVPKWVDAAKLEAIQRNGAEVIQAGGTYDEAEARAQEIRRSDGRVYVHPFDDPLVIAGQGTISGEILDVLPTVTRIIVPLSGGGLAAGVARAAKAVHPEVRITAVSAERANVMVRSLEAGRPIEVAEEPTLASALSGGIGIPNHHTFEMVKDLVDEHVLVSEDEILRAMAFAVSERGLVVEGGGAVGLAALLAAKLPDCPHEAGEGATAIILSGGNVSLAGLADLIPRSG